MQQDICHSHNTCRRHVITHQSQRQIYGRAHSRTGHNAPIIHCQGISALPAWITAFLQDCAVFPMGCVIPRSVWVFRDVSACRLRQQNYLGLAIAVSRDGCAQRQFRMIGFCVANNKNIIGRWAICQGFTQRPQTRTTRHIPAFGRAIGPIKQCGWIDPVRHTQHFDHA